MTSLASFLDSLDGAVVVGHGLLFAAALWLICAVSQMLALHGRSRR